MKKRITLLNICTSLILQFVTIISGFIIPKIILNYFGSETNGLISTINQFLSYISLIEGGVTGVITASLYKPLVENDLKKINSIINTTSNFYKKIGIIFIIYSFIIAIFYPILFRTNFSYFFIFVLTLILSINLLVQYMFSLTLKTLLIADKKMFIISITQTVMIILNVILVFICVKVYPNIHFIKLISGSLFLLQPVVFSRYVHKHYRLDKNVDIDLSLLSKRWNGFAINVAAFIHNSTDITILSLFTNLSTVSVYSIYSLVTIGLKQLINAIASPINSVIGYAYAKNDLLELNEKMDLYEYIIFFLVYFMFSCAALLITPFVMIYTKGVNDTNYNQMIFGFLLVISEALYLIKFPHLNLAYCANKFKEITKPAFIEAFINIVVSVLLVKNIGILGVAIGTIAAMIYRMVFHVRFTSELIPNRRQRIFYSKLLIFSCGLFIGIFISLFFFSPVNISLLSWIIHALIYSFIFLFIYILISFIFYKKEVNYFFCYLKKRRK